MEGMHVLVKVTKKESKAKVNKSDVESKEHQVVLEGSEAGVVVKVTIKSDVAEDLKKFNLKQWWRLKLEPAQATLTEEEE